MTTVTISRATTADDEYGDPQPATWADWKTFGNAAGEKVLVGWGNPDEPLEAGANTVITNRTVYIRTTAPTGILATDRATIDGVTYAIDGSVAEWANNDEYVGAQFAVKAVS